MPGLTKLVGIESRRLFIRPLPERMVNEREHIDTKVACLELRKGKTIKMRISGCTISALFHVLRSWKLVDGLSF